MHAVLNWLWQGCVVALALFAMLGLLERARANVRYVVCWAAQVLVLLLPLVAMLESGGGAPGRLPRVPVEAVVSVPDAWWTSGLVIAAAWLGWAGVGAVRFVRAILALRRARASSRPFPPQAESPLTHWRQVRGRARRPQLVVSDSVTAAAVLGCGVPMIAVAPALATRLEADELDRVLVHEWAHVQRRDDLVNLLQIAIRIVAGWHPAVWWIDRRLQAEREIACDETTVAITGAPKSYAACLVKLAGLTSVATAPLAAPGVLAARGLRARITRIVSQGAFLPPQWSFSCAAAIAVVLAMVSVAVAQTKLVEPTVFEFPYESIRMAGARLERLAPVAVPVALSRQEIATIPPQRTAIAARPEPPSIEVAPAPAASVTQEAGAPAPAPAPAAPSVAVESPEPHASEATPAAVPPVQSVAVPVDRERSPWAETADGGKAIGRVSKEAGLATAGFFSKFGRRVAGSF
jgi:beta-lactamase regulating signal transducer with metallopeptidase domain